MLLCRFGLAATSGSPWTIEDGKFSHPAKTKLGERNGDLIGIGAAVTHRPLPHHRAYGSVHGGSIGYASNPRLTMEDRGTGSGRSIARPRELRIGPSTTDRDRCQRCYPRAADALPVRSVPRGDDGRFSTVATTRLAVAAGPIE